MMKTLHGFISPSGEFKECVFQGHMDLADDIAKEILECKDWLFNAEKVLAEYGWMVVNKYFVGIENQYLGKNQRKFLTDIQVKWILDNMESLTENQKESVNLTLSLEKMLRR